MPPTIARMKHENDSIRRTRAFRVCGGFTLAESMVAVFILSLVTLACFSTITFSRGVATKAKEQAIAVDFLMHYTELVRGLPYNEVATGNPINPLFDGDSGSPDIRIPASGTWLSLNTNDYETFHPDLIWLHNRQPKLRVTLGSERVNGLAHAKHLKISIAWDAPLGLGARLHQDAELIRVQDL